MAARAVFGAPDCSVALFNSSFSIFNSDGLPGKSLGSASASKAGMAVSPAIQRPCLVMPIGRTSYLSRSSAAITARAEVSETSCSPDWPPNRTPTRILLAIRIAYDLYFQLQRYAECLQNALACDVDQPQNIVAGSAA